MKNNQTEIDPEILKTISENAGKFAQEAKESFDKAATSISCFGKHMKDFECATPVKLKVNSCSHCGDDIGTFDTVYCEKCYQLLIAKNAKLQLYLKQSIPTMEVEFFMKKLRDILIKQTNMVYTPDNKLKDIMQLYIQNIDKLGGVKNVSYDQSIYEGNA